MMSNQAPLRQRLMDVAHGLLAPDLVIKGGRLVNVLSREIYPANILIYEDRVAAVGDLNWCYAPHTKVIEADGFFVAPGLIDPHVHIESSSVTVTEYVKWIVPRGVTTVVEDPHEIANILGIHGIKLLFDEAKTLPLNVLLRVPGCVPGLPQHAETSGAIIDVEDTKEMLDWPLAVQLAGDYNARLILEKNPELLQKIDAAIARNLTVGGQFPGLSEADLNAYVAIGLEDSHVATSVPEVISQLRNGLRVILAPKPFLRQNADNFGKLAELMKSQGLDRRRLMLCTDDLQADGLYRDGHLDGVIRMAIKQGMDPVIAIQMATINVAEHLRIARHIGSVTAGKRANIVILDDLNEFSVDSVIVSGQLVARNGVLLESPDLPEFPQQAKQTIRLDPSVLWSDLPIRVDSDEQKVKVRLLHAKVPKTVTYEELDVVDGMVQPDQSRDILSMAVFDRHTQSGRIGKVFVHGTGIKDGAMASSVCHDAHNLFVIGTDYRSMAVAVNAVIQSQGGLAAVWRGQLVGQIELPIAGLMSQAPLSEIARQFTRFEQEILRKKLQCQLGDNALSYLCVMLSLANIPHWGVSDQGLINSASLTRVDSIVRS